MTPEDKELLDRANMLMGRSVVLVLACITLAVLSVVVFGDTFGVVCCAISGMCAGVGLYFCRVNWKTRKLIKGGSEK